MKSLIYISRGVVEFNQQSLLELTQQAQEHNASIGVTGYLWFKHGQFTQYLEGHADNINPLMSKIEMDERHDILYKIDEFQLNTRRFPDWHMLYIDTHSPQRASLESILKDQLMSMKSIHESQQRLSEGVCRTIDSIASHYRIRTNAFEYEE